MNKKSLRALFLSCFILTSYAAQSQEIIAPVPMAAPVINWVSESPGDVKTIQNTTGVTYTVLIVVNDDGSDNAAGINVNNCGQTSNIGPGSSALCNSTDPNNPITFSSDRAKQASGTYQIQLPTS